MLGAFCCGLRKETVAWPQLALATPHQWATDGLGLSQGLSLPEVRHSFILVESQVQVRLWVFEGL